MRMICATLAVFSICFAGCVSWISVKPSEVPKVGNMTVGMVSSGPHRGHAVAVSVAKLERSDGTLVEIKGKPDVRITSDGEVFTFKHPIEATLHGEVLTIQSSNRAATKFHLSNIQKVEVSEPNLAANVLLSLLGGLALSGIIIAACMLAL